MSVTKPVLNQFQIAVAKAYGHGDFAHICDLPAETCLEAIADCGDTLFKFLMLELADEGFAPDLKMDFDTANQRLESALLDLGDALMAINPDGPDEQMITRTPKCTYLH